MNQLDESKQSREPGREFREFLRRSLTAAMLLLFIVLALCDVNPYTLVFVLFVPVVANLGSSR